MAFSAVELETLSLDRSSHNSQLTRTAPMKEATVPLRRAARRRSSIGNWREMEPVGDGSINSGRAQSRCLSHERAKNEG